MQTCSDLELNLVTVFQEQQFVGIRNVFMEFCITCFLISVAIGLYEPVQMPAAEMCVSGSELM